METTHPTRVAIVGGGCAAMAAALELTRPEHDGRFAVTVYQLGWRLGGKGASGRGPAGRIEEHGLHLWMGWYENAFRLMRECYDELGRDWREAFEPAPLVAVTDKTPDGAWTSWIRAFPPAEGLPGDPLAPDQQWTVGHYVIRTATLIRTLLAGIEPVGPAGVGSDTRPGDQVLDAIGTVLRYGELGTMAAISQAVALLETALGALSQYPSNALLALLDAIANNARRLLEARLTADPDLQRVWHVIDLALATIRGNIRFGLLTDPRGFDAVDDYDCREWLLLNGASPAAVDSGYLRGLYDLGFGYEDGDVTRPRVSAAQSLRGFLRAFFTYRGAFFWKMNAGMGDVVFAPMYEVLRRRGVRFEFFHRLRNVSLANAAADAQHVTTLDFDVQARTKHGRPYDPLVDVDGIPCWPAQPDLAQLEHGERFERERWQFECHWDDRRVDTKTLRVGQDFDFVVLGVGLGAVPYVCRELVARDPRWREMVEHVKTVATQAFQIWMEPDMEALGWPGPPVTLSGFVEPFDTWADMRHLLPREQWPDKPGALAYFCSVLSDLDDVAPTDPAYAERQREVVRRNAVGFLERDVRHLWPAAVTESGEFRWDLLVSAEARGPHVPRGAARFATQYWTANVNPSDRYTLALPGSSRYRISPLDRTYDNLTVCGDWTDSGINSGCVEAAIVSGRLAAHALSQQPALEDIVGFDHP
jgi:uncharacterized protein with NAD-binding domain and iron-sulfur cluster